MTATALLVEPFGSVDAVDWNGVVRQLRSQGWARLQGALDAEHAEGIEQAAPGPWRALPETEGSAEVRQAGLTCHSAVDDAGPDVMALAGALRRGIDKADAPDVGPLPAFNHAEWCRAAGGQKYITPHRDPDTAGGVIAVVTIRGRATFRVWTLDGSPDGAKQHPELATEWETGDGDIVLMRRGGWPTPFSRCPIHEAESPRRGDRVTLTLRHNKGGYGADYFHRR